MTSSQLNWGIIGTGIIAHKFAEALSLTQGGKLMTAASKDFSKAQAFCSKHNIVPAKNYIELVQNPSVDVVYIATTHNFHYENALLALEHNKHVLLEKPFTVNAQQAQSLIDLAKKKNRFLMEAIWVRYLPAMQKLKSMVLQGVIGEVKAFNLSFGGFAPPHYLPRIINPDLAGGVTLDMGIYPITFIHFLTQSLPTESKSFARMSDLGVDEIATYQFRYPSGCLATVVTSFNLLTKFEAMIYGSTGYIEFPNFQEGNKFTVNIHNGTRNIQSSQQVELEHHPNGFIYQVDAVNKLIREGATESPIIPLDETVKTMQLMDSLRAEWGFKYPFELSE